MTKKIRYCLLILLPGLISMIVSPHLLYSQDNGKKPSRQTAMDAFAKEDFERAFREFSLLLQNYSRDPLYKYYSGVCLVKMNAGAEDAVSLLQDAVSGKVEIKSVPVDAWFYLGRSQQMAGRYQEAMRSYDVFSSEAGRKVAREYNVDQYIQECREGRGMTLTQKIPENVVLKPPPEREDLPDNVDRMLADGIKYQLKADSINTVVEGYRKTYGQMPESQKTAAKARISEAEALAARYQKMADEKLGITTPSPSVKKDSSVVPVKAGEGKTLTQEVPQGTPPPKSPVMKKTSQVFSVFEVITDPVKIQNQKVEIDPKLPSGLTYRIQLGVFSKPVATSFFKGVMPAYGIRSQSSGVIKYYAGLFRRMSDAGKALLTVKQLGHNQSFIVAFLDDGAISVERAAVLEKDWSVKPLYEAVEETPPTLSYRVEITRSDKPLKDEVVDSYRKLAGNRGLEILNAEGAISVYLIGKFITFESASEYADLLIRNGYRDARVVAYLGTREIPLETAKELFERIE